MKHFFISYNSADRKWAEWIAWQLEEAGYTTLLQAWDFRPGSNFIIDMQEATKDTDRTIAVLSPDYLKSMYTQPEWTAAFAQDPTGKKKKLLPVRVRDCDLEGLWSQIVYVDLIDQDEVAAKKVLLKGVKRGRVKPKKQPGFPGPSKHSITKPSRFPGALPPIWNVPHHRNANFTGREKILQDLRTALISGKSTALTQQAIHGLGGVGKTQLALEYAYRYASEYDMIWWIRAEDTVTLAADYANLAKPLNLPEKDEVEQNRIVVAVRNWFNQNSGWLLIFDNAQEMNALRQYLPQGAAGHVLITSRNVNWEGIANSFAVSVFNPQESIDFLCKRTGQNDKDTAGKLADFLGHLPLALEQAAAYIKAAEKSLSSYLELYQLHQQKILEHSKLSTDYPYTVATTWELSFERLKEQAPVAAELLNLCAFLAPENIPRDSLSSGINGLRHTSWGAFYNLNKFLLGSTVSSAPNTSPTIFSLTGELEFDEAILALRTYSLINVGNDEFSLHRLVQAVIRNRLSQSEKQHWAEAAVWVALKVFPEITLIDERKWPECERWLAHALAAATAAEAENTSMDNVSVLFEKVGRYLMSRENYNEAEPLLRRSLKISENVHGADDPSVGTRLNTLAVLYSEQGNYSEAEALHRRVLRIEEMQSSTTDSNTLATTLNNLAESLRLQGKHQEAEPFYERSRKIHEKTTGADSLDTATALNNMAESLRAQGKYSEAEPMFRRVLEILEKIYGQEHSLIAATLNNLAMVLLDQGKLTEAEPILRRALTVMEKQFGQEHGWVATTMNNLAGLLQSLNRCKEAEKLFRRALTIDEKVHGSSHPDVARDLNNLAHLLYEQGKLSEVKPLFRRALEIFEKHLGSEHPTTISVRKNLASL